MPLTVSQSIHPSTVVKLYLGTMTTMPNDSTSILINFNYDLLIRSIHRVLDASSQ